MKGTKEEYSSCCQNFQSLCFTFARFCVVKQTGFAAKYVSENRTKGKNTHTQKKKRSQGDKCYVTQSHNYSGRTLLRNNFQCHHSPVTMQLRAYSLVFVLIQFFSANSAFLATLQRFSTLISKKTNLLSIKGNEEKEKRSEFRGFVMVIGPSGILSYQSKLRYHLRKKLDISYIFSIKKDKNNNNNNS